MVSQLQSSTQPEIIYPDSDGQPMADNTKQFRWIVTIKENLERLFRDRADVFVAGDLLWYPVEGNNTLRQAPDAMVALGRPKGDRGSYKQWEEDNIPPQVVFEILSPGNRMGRMARKFQFYNLYGVEEYYVYDPDDVELIGWLRTEQALEVIENMDGWVSPRLQIRFDLSEPELQIFYPDGSRFLTYVELADQLDQEQQRAEVERQRAEAERQRAEAERQRADELEQQLQQYRDRFGDLSQ
ncbi:MAG: Uma2 family endonuclease [Leptolyngbyaceae cyanobacterium bins.302]|nr:Uma2 family endonuclease [Leptolyngbyaceae cyanobacterium bins.302]